MPFNLLNLFKLTENSKRQNTTAIKTRISRSSGCPRIVPDSICDFKNFMRLGQKNMKFNEI